MTLLYSYSWRAVGYTFVWAQTKTETMIIAELPAYVPGWSLAINLMCNGVAVFVLSVIALHTNKRIGAVSMTVCQSLSLVAPTLLAMTWVDQQAWTAEIDMGMALVGLVWYVREEMGRG
jgi:hypothetical protein